MRKESLMAPILGLLVLGVAVAQDNVNCQSGNAAVGDPASSTGGPTDLLPLAADSTAVPGGDPSAAPPRGPGGRRGGPRPGLTAEERAQLDAMTPDQRKAFFEAKRQAFLASLSPEERAKMEAHRKEHEARIAAMTPEERAAMKARGPGQRKGGRPRAPRSSTSQ